MPAIGSISVNDAESTPVAHAFAPVTTDGALARFANRNATVPAGYETLSIEMRSPVGATGAYRLFIKGADPTTATVDGVEKVVKTNSFDFTINFAPLSTAQERLNLMKILSGILDHTTVKSVAQNVEPIY